MGTTLLQLLLVVVLVALLVVTVVVVVVLELLVRGARAGGRDCAGAPASCTTGSFGAACAEGPLGASPCCASLGVDEGRPSVDGRGRAGATAGDAWLAEVALEGVGAFGGRAASEARCARPAAGRFGALPEGTGGLEGRVEGGWGGWGGWDGASGAPELVMLLRRCLGAGVPCGCWACGRQRC